VERQFLGTLLRLGRLAVDKNPQSAFLIFHEEIEVLLVDLSLFQKDQTPFEFLCVLPDQFRSLG